MFELKPPAANVRWDDDLQRRFAAAEALTDQRERWSACMSIALDRGNMALIALVLGKIVADYGVKRMAAELYQDEIGLMMLPHSEHSLAVSQMVDILRVAGVRLGAGPA